MKKLTAEQRRVFDVTKEEAVSLATHGFEPRVVWVRPGGIDMSAKPCEAAFPSWPLPKYTKREALTNCLVPSWRAEKVPS